MSLDKLEQWIDDLSSHMYINCVYCGHRFCKQSESGQHPVKKLVEYIEKLIEHMEHCSKHPMSKLIVENKRLRAELKNQIGESR